MEIKNLKKSASRILKAVKNKEKIILYGDADFDGISSVIILEESIKILGGRVSAFFFPDREKEGYGLNESALNYLKKYAPALLILLDCGIGNFKEVEIAGKMGFDVVIIDHHKVLNNLPVASIIVDPRQKGEKYPFREFATAGIVFRLARILLKNNFSEAAERDFLTLTGLATIADMMTKTDDNKEFIEKGLVYLKNTARPGLKVFYYILPDFFNKNPIEFAQKIISACHAGGTHRHLNEGYLLFTAASTEKAKMLARKLLKKARLRQLKIKKIVEKIEKKLSKQREDPIIFEGDKSLEILMAGPAASIICRNHNKPIFLYGHRKAESQGAVRTPKNIDGVKAMMSCANFLEVYGGHPQAAGFKIKNKNLKSFKECLMGYFKSFEKYGKK